MKTIAIMGMGLMGSSLGLALKARGVPVRVSAYARREDTRVLALERGMADAVFADPAEAVKGAKVVVFCVPILTTPELAKACLPSLKPGAVLTDVGSTKAELNRLMTEALAGTDAVFVGSHPISGSEQQGIEAAVADLYEGAVTIVTPDNDAPAAAVEEISGLWKSAGSTVHLMEAETHDRILASTSHLPHLVAATLALSVGSDGTFCGSGFRDTTRIAEGSPKVWSDIVRTNAPALKEALKDFRVRLDELAARVEEGDGDKLTGWFDAARDQRKELLG